VTTRGREKGSTLADVETVSVKESFGEDSHAKLNKRKKKEARKRVKKYKDKAFNIGKEGRSNLWRRLRRRKGKKKRQSGREKSFGSRGLNADSNREGGSEQKMKKGGE